MASEVGELHRGYWLAQAAAVRRRVNLAWWLETVSAPLVALSIAGAGAVLWVRREIPSVGPGVLAAWLGAAVVLLGLVCLAVAARRFEKQEESLVRIEAAMRLRNALSAALAGVAPWPAPARRADAGLNWQWPRLIVPLAGALALLGAGLWVPVSPRRAVVSSAPEEPQAWKQLSTELDRLTKEQLVDEKYLEETQKKLDDLKAQKEEQWFSHSSLEATDTLKKDHRAESNRVQRQLGKADDALAGLEKNPTATSQAEKDRMMEEFDQALQGLQTGAMKPNPKLLEQMGNLDLKDLADLPPAQLEELREALRENAKGLQKAKGEEGEGEGDSLAEGDGDGEGEGDKPGDGTGSGGVDRGPGHAPGVLGAKKDAVETGETAALQTKDLSHAAPGDLLELQNGKHEVDRSASKLSGGGGTEATGKGGDRVWRESLDPDEQRVLKRYFE